MQDEKHDDDTASLIVRHRNGDCYARDRILQRHGARLKRMVQLRMDARLQSRFDPSDVLQESILIASQRLDQFPFDVEKRQSKLPLYVWMRRIVWEQLIKFHEKHLGASKRSVLKEIGHSPKLRDESIYTLVERLTADQSTPSQELIKEERQTQLLDALKELNPCDRSILELRYVEHLTASEIAAILKISQEAVRTRHFRAIRRLNRLLSA